MGKKNKKVNMGGGARAKQEGPPQEEELVKALKNLTVREISTAAIWDDKKFALLKVVRLELADKERLARRTEFIEKNREGIIARADFPQRMMQLFPEEVWEVIVKRAGSEEKALMTNMTRQWRRLLKEERTTFLMPEVFPILFMNGIFAYAPNEILKFRLVCKDWNRGVETCVHNYVDLPGFNVENAATVPQRPEMNITYPPGPGSYNFLLAGLSIPLPQGSQQPFVGRKILFDIPNVPALVACPNFWRQAELLFGGWGHELWHLYVELRGGLGMEYVYQFLCEYLAMTPNLRSVGISCNHCVPQNIDQLLKPRIAANPLPELDLRSLYIGGLPDRLGGALLRKYGASLETLSLSQPGDYFKRSHLPRLKKVGLQLTGRIKEPLFPVDWPALEEVEVNFYPRGCEGGDILKLFQSFNSFGGSLRRLTLRITGGLSEPQIKLGEKEKRRLWLELPHLEDFKLIVWGVNLNTIDFILPMKSLKELEVKYVKTVSSFETKTKVKDAASPSLSGTLAAAKLPEGVIQFSNHTNCLYESNIWGLFPELATVTIGVVRKLKNAWQGPTAWENGMPTREELQTKKEAILKGRMIKRKVYTRLGYNKQQQGQGGANANGGV